MAHGRRLVRALAALALGVGLMASVEASGAQTPDPDFPNLPERVDRARSPLISGYVSNLAYVGPSRQWLQLVDVKVTAAVLVGNPSNQGNCAAIFGEGSPRCRNERPDAVDKNAFHALAYPNNFVGDDVGSPPANRSELRRLGAEFDDFPAQRVRLLAFGSVPAEATLHLGLVKDSSGLPMALELDADNYLLGRTVGQEVTDTVGSGQLRVRLSDVTVDGRPVDVGSDCQLRDPANLSLVGRGYRSLTMIEVVPPGRYNPNYGGTLQGQLAVGQFAGCNANGDDLSPLINAMAGNAELAVRIEQAEVKPACFTSILPLPIRESSCFKVGELEYPEGEELPDLPPSYQPPPPVN